METGSNCEQISVLIKLSLFEKYYRKPNQPEFDILDQEGKSKDTVLNRLMMVLELDRVRRKGEGSGETGGNTVNCEVVHEIG